MTTLQDFLALPNVNEEVEEVFINKRLGTFKVKPMSNEQYNEYLMRSRKMSIGKKSSVDFDNAKYNLLLITNHVIEPNFRDAAVLQAGGFNNPYELINAKLRAGEIEKIAEKIADVSGLNGDIEEKIEEAKNS